MGRYEDLAAAHLGDPEEAEHRDQIRDVDSKDEFGTPERPSQGIFAIGNDSAAETSADEEDELLS